MSVDLSGVADMRQRFEAYGAKAFPRAVQYSLNKVAEAASLNFRQALPKALDTPVPFTARGISFRRARLSEAKLDNLQSAMTVLPVQSTYLKYVLGQGPNVRTAGDIGLSRNAIWVPVFSNIEKAMGIKVRAGGLPPGAAGKIIRRRDEKIEPKPRRTRGMSDEAWDAYESAWRRRRAQQKRWGVFSGKITMRGRKADAIIARPPVKEYPSRGIGDRTEKLRRILKRSSPGMMGLMNNKRLFFDKRGRVKNPTALYPIDVPRVLFIKRPSTKHNPIAQQAWDEAVTNAATTIRPTMEHELKRKIQDLLNRRMWGPHY